MSYKTITRLLLGLGAAVAIALPTSAAPVTPDTPVRHLYAVWIQYAKAAQGDPPMAAIRQDLTPRFYQDLVKGYKAGHIDVDPFCATQNTTYSANVSHAPRKVGPARWEVPVVLQGDPRPSVEVHTVKLYVVWYHGGYRVDDLYQMPELPSVRKWLEN